MRIIRLQINELVSEKLAEINRQYRTGDKGFVEDVYSLLRFKGSGMPTAERLQKITDVLVKKGKLQAISARILVNKRAQVLKAIISTALFKALSTFSDPIDATKRLLVNFQRLYLKYREAQCRSCNLLNQCDFGKQYMKQTPNIGRVIDPDWKKKIHPQCPVMPMVEFTNQIWSSMQTLKTMVQSQQPEAKLTNVPAEKLAKDEEEAEEEMLDTEVDDDLDDDLMDMEDADVPNFADPTDTGEGRHGFGSTYTGGHSGAEYVEHFENMVNRLAPEQLVIFEIGKKFDTTLLKDKKGEFRPTEELSQDKQIEKIENISQVHKVLPVSHGLPEELFEKKLDKKQLDKADNVQRIAKKKLLYILVDNSGSMRLQIDPNRYGFMTRGSLACVFSMTLCKRVRDDGGIVFCRFFAGGVSSRMNARKREEFDDIMFLMSRADFNGGGTDIANALRVTLADIASAKDEVNRSEIILVSDAEDNFQPAPIKALLGKQELNTIDISCTGGLQYGAARALKAISKKYYKVNPNNVDIDKIVEVV